MSVEEWATTTELASVWLTADLARRADPDEHDEQLAAACRRVRTFEHVPVVVPPGAASGAHSRVMQIAQSSSCRVMRLCPSSHCYPLQEWVVSPIPEICERYRCALMLDFDPLPVSWSDVVLLARRFAATPMVVVGSEVDTDRALPAALDAAANLVVQITGTEAPAALARLVGTFGAARFVWGSRAQARATRAAIGALGRAPIDDDARADVLYGNAQALAAGGYAKKHL